MNHIIQNTSGFAEEKYKTIEDHMQFNGFESLPVIVMEFLEDP